MQRFGMQDGVHPPRRATRSRTMTSKLLHCDKTKHDKSFLSLLHLDCEETHNAVVSLEKP